MKKVWRVVIAGVVICVGGIVVLLCALGASGWKLDNVNGWETETVTVEQEVSKLKIEASVGKVQIKRSSTDVAVIKYEYNEQFEPKITEQDGILTIKTAQKHWYEFGFFWFGNTPSIEIELPEGWTPALDLTLNAGAIEIGDGNWGAQVAVVVNAGALAMNKVTTDELKLQVNAGGFSASNVKCGKATVLVNAGGADLNQIVCNEFVCRVNAGGVDVKKLDSSKIELNVSAGGIDLGVVGAKSDYNVSVKKSAGSCNVSSQTNAQATRTLDIHISAGSIDVDFAA